MHGLRRAVPAGDTVAWNLVEVTTMLADCPLVRAFPLKLPFPQQRQALTSGVGRCLGYADLTSSRLVLELLGLHQKYAQVQQRRMPASRDVGSLFSFSRAQLWRAE